MTEGQTDMQPINEPAPWQHIPADMAVAAVPTVWATNISRDGTVWLWFRTPSSCSATPFAPDAAEHVAKALHEAAQIARTEAGGIAIVEAPILGPDGRPLA